VGILQSSPQTGGDGAAVEEDKILSAQKRRRQYRLPPELELERIVTMTEAYELSGLSPDAWRDNYPELIIQLSPKRQGIKLKHVLNVGQSAA
jgi:hypothetical protein